MRITSPRSHSPEMTMVHSMFQTISCEFTTFSSLKIQSGIVLYFVLFIVDQICPMTCPHGDNLFACIPSMSSYSHVDYYTQHHDKQACPQILAHLWESLQRTDSLELELHGLGASIPWIHPVWQTRPPPFLMSACTSALPTPIRFEPGIEKALREGLMNELMNK